MKGASDVLEYLDTQSNYPLTLKFGKQTLSTNDKVRLKIILNFLNRTF